MKFFVASVATMAVSASDVTKSAFRAEMIKKHVDTMDKGQALAMLQKKNNDAHEKVSSLLSTEAKKLKKETAEKAVGTLNNMYLEAEATLDDKIFACTVEEKRLADMIERTEDELKDIGGKIEDGSTISADAKSKISMTENDINDVENKGANEKGAYDETKAMDDAELARLEAHLGAVSFILEIAQCKQKSLLLLNQQEKNVKSQILSCAQQDADNKDYMINLFADKEVQDLVENDLSVTQQQQLHGIMSEAVDNNQDEDQEEAAASAFVQLGARAAPFKTCKGVEPDCAIMTDKVGGMYGDARDDVDKLKALMKQRADKFEALKTENNEMHGSLVSFKGMASKELGTATGELTTLDNSKSKISERLRSERKARDTYWGKCLTDVEKIMYDGVCSILNVRKNVLDKAAKTLGVKPDALQECEMGEWQPAGNCKSTRSGKEVACVNEKKMLSDEEWERVVQHHQRPWARSPMVAPPEGDKIALPCPEKMTNSARCNEFLCPINCMLTNYSPYGPCSKDCGSGIKLRSRKPSQRPQHGGTQCDSMTETQTCNEGSCDVDCKLRATPKEYGPCVRACREPRDKDPLLNSMKPYRVGSRPIVIATKGKGKCPKKWSTERARKKYCNTSKCRGDEKCTAHMDIVFAIDSSGSTGENGWATFQNFTSELISKMLPEYAEKAAVKVGIVQFGNGALIKRKVNGLSQTMVAPANLITDKPTKDMKKAVKLLEKAKWAKGFSNMAQGINTACLMLQRRGREHASRHVIMISDGKPTLEWATNQAAMECKDKGTILDFIVVNANFDAKNKAWQSFKKLPSYPWTAHTHHINGMNQLLMNPKQLASTYLPRICPKADSIKNVIQKATQKGYVLLHKGRDCGNWWKFMGRHRTASGCARRALRDGYKSFVFQFHRMFRSSDGTFYCWSHKKQGKKVPWEKNDPFKAIDSTCTCTNRYCTGKVKGGKKGWGHQRQLKYSGYSHYAVIDDKAWYEKHAGKHKFNSLTTLAQVDSEVDDTETETEQEAVKETEEDVKENDAEENVEAATSDELSAIIDEMNIRRKNF